MNLAIIPARGGSLRIPRKNIRLFHGKPIIAYSIEAAKESGLFDLIVVSTEDEEIARIAHEFGAATIVRPPELAVDEVGTQEVARHACDLLRNEFEFACCIYATAPMMTAQDLRICFQQLKESFEDYVYIPGWLYWGKASTFIANVPLEQRQELHPAGWIDINTELDWTIAEQMYAALHPLVPRGTIFFDG